LTLFVAVPDEGAMENVRSNFNIIMFYSLS